MSRTLGLLHTLEANIEVFEGLARELGFEGEIVHRVEENTIADLQAAGGVDDAIASRIRSEIEGLVSFPVDLVACTCSSIGAVAEAMNGTGGKEVQRIDRAMADAAVAAGRRIAILATLPSTFAATRELVESSARQASREVAIEEIEVEGAWERYAAGDMDGYQRAIADRIEPILDSFDAIVLAQASMADATSLLADSSIPVLSSPELGLRKAIHALNSLES